MKKFVAFILALVMILSLAACGSSQSAEKTWEDELGTAGLLRVGIATDYPPYES